MIKKKDTLKDDAPVTKYQWTTFNDCTTFQIL